jgi:four helix bundle protein
MKITKFTDLIAWQKGHELVLDIYRLVKKFPKHEQFALSNQMTRCAVSITSNLAEGFSRQTNKEKIQFYFTAKGSLTELQNQLLIARDVDYLSSQKFKKLAEATVEVHKLINGLIKAIK